MLDRSSITPAMQAGLTDRVWALADIADMGIPISELVVSAKGGNPRLQGTWIHPDIAVNLGQWLSPKFAVLVSKWVREWMSGKIVGGNLPYPLRRSYQVLICTQNKVFESVASREWTRLQKRESPLSLCALLRL